MLLCKVCVGHPDAHKHKILLPDQKVDECVATRLNTEVSVVFLTLKTCCSWYPPTLYLTPEKEVSVTSLSTIKDCWVRYLLFNGGLHCCAYSVSSSVKTSGLTEFDGDLTLQQDISF